MDFTTRTIQLKDVKIEYLLSRNKNSETILFVHGLGANMSQYEFQQNYFSEKYTVLLVNLRGHGNTKLLHEATTSDFELNKMANDVIELLNILKISKVHFVGNSMGGNIGYEVLRSNPEILKSFTTFGTTGQLNTSDFSLKTMIFTYKLMGSKIIGNLATVAGQTKKSKQKIKEMMSRINKSTLVNIVPNLGNFDYLDVIKSSRTPSLIIKGGKDKSINKVINNTIAEFENRGDFKLYEMKETGHFANLDNPDLFNKVLEENILNSN